MVTGKQKQKQKKGVAPSPPARQPPVEETRQPPTETAQQAPPSETPPPATPVAKAEDTVTISKAEFEKLKAQMEYMEKNLALHSKENKEKHGLIHSIFSRSRPSPKRRVPPSEAPAVRVGSVKTVKAKAAKVKDVKAKDGEPSKTALRMLRLYRRFSAVMPPKLMSYFQQHMKYAGISEERSAIVLGRSLLVSFLAGAIPLMLYLVIFNPDTTPITVSIAVGLFFGGMILTLFLHYLSLYFSIADRSAAVEKMLPDFLSLVVSNLRAGMSPYAAFVHAARPEFGAFHEAVMLSMSKMGGKGSIVEALIDVSGNFDSPILRRTVTLFAKGVRSGGQLVRLLNSSAEEVRRIQDLRAELIAATRTYSIFLSFIVVAVMPFLLAVSTNFVGVFVRLEMDTSGATSNMPGGVQMPSFSGKILVTPDDMQNISFLTLLVIDLMVSILIGVVDRGKVMYGIKSFPVLAILSIIAFTLAKAFIGNFLAGFMI
jgi:pilus assembly protein TadC